MGMLNLKVAKAPLKTRYSKGDSSGRKPFLRTVITQGGDDEAPLLVLPAGHLAHLPAVYLYFRTSMNGCMALEIHAPLVSYPPPSLLFSFRLVQFPRFLIL